MPPEPIRIPLADWAGARLAELARLSGSAAIARLDGATLLGERAAIGGFVVPGRVSAGGGCRLLAARDGEVALNLARSDDRALLPALIGADDFDPGDDRALAARLALLGEADMVARGRQLGLAIAGLNETAASPALVMAVPGQSRQPSPAPLVIDLAALWAGPLAAHLLGLGGARVVKVESRNRADTMRHGDPALFARINGGKASVALDLRAAADREALLALIRRADAVIEAARPRALLQLGIDAEALVREVPGLVWATLTGHGSNGDAAQWVGFGDDTAIAGGLGAALRDTTGTSGFVGDAIGDPLSGIVTASAVAGHLRRGQGARLIVSMSGVVAGAVADRCQADAAGFAQDLRRWSEARGQPFPAVAERSTGPVASLGADNTRWLAAG